MSGEKKDDLRQHVRLLLDEANALRRGWNELLPQLENLGPDVGTQEIISKVRAIIDELERKAEKLQERLPH